MYIKKVALKGFMSYRDRIEAKEFSPHVNTIVGANGSGKTNFHRAIRFVVNDIFKQLSSDQRHSILHGPPQAKVMDAYVEVTLDNSDGRFPVREGEVTIRRTIGSKKDDFYVNSKNTRRQELVNMLESAGFSGSNPYYVVEQGRISKFATMRPEDRLEVLKEMGGANVYETKRNESIKELEKTEKQRAEIEEALSDINSRIDELESEKAELAEYNRLDKQKRALEHALYEKALADARRGIDDVEQKKQQASEQKRELGKQHGDAQSRFEELEKQEQGLQEELQQQRKERESLASARNEISEKKISLDVEIGELKEELHKMESRSKEAQSTLDDVSSKIEQMEGKKKDLQLKIDNEKAQESQLKARYSEAERTLRQLRARQSESSNFSNAEERDKWLEECISKEKSTIERHQTEINTLQGEIDELAQKQQQAEQEAERARSQAKDFEESIAENEKALGAKREEYNRILDERRGCWEKEERHRGELREIEQKVDTCTRRLEGSIPREVNRGLKAVEKIVKDHQIEGYYGTLLDNIACDERVDVAVDVTGNQSLLNILVEDDEVASRILDHLNRSNSGRITLMPLNKVHGHDVKTPDPNKAIRLADKIKCDDKFRHAMCHVFGKTLLCPDLDTATKLAQGHNVDCVTVEGEQKRHQVERRGAMSGGYNDRRQSRVALARHRKESEEKRRETKQEYNNAVASREEAEQRLHNASTDIEKLKSKGENSERARKDAQRNATQRKSEAERMNADIESKRETITTEKEKIGKSEAMISEMQSQLNTPLHSDLTRQEQDQLLECKCEMDQLSKQLDEVHHRKQELEDEKRANKQKLEQSLYRQRESLEEETPESELASLRRKLHEKQSEQEGVEAQLNDKDSQLQAIDRKLDELQKQESNAASEKDAVEKEARDSMKKMQEADSKFESLQTKQDEYQAKRDENIRLMRELGAPPRDAYESYAHMSPQELKKLLGETSEQLKQYGHVNKKALDQHTSFADEKEKLQERYQELLDSKTKIQELIEMMDNKKNEDLHRTFRQVSHHFDEVFSKLVPGGHAKMVWKRRRGGENEDTIQNYSGVNIKVSFGGQEGTMSMEQLSGGQKTLVALTLIFAIQMCDPAPFCLFDEIDAALDPNYRANVATLIAEEAKKGRQFIATTFGRDMVNVSDMIFGVSHTRSISAVEPIGKDEAQAFLHDIERRQQEHHEMADGEEDDHPQLENG